MSIKTGKQLGFFAALTMLIGSVVGIGIFFKSHGILRANDWNGTGTLIAWILGGLLCLAAAISFSEIGSIKTKKVSGIAAYSEILGGKKLGYFTRFNFSFFYFGILIAALGFFGSEILIGTFASLSNKFKVDEVPLYGHAIVAFAIVVFFLTVNFLSVKTSGIIAQVSTILKWVPLALVAVLGIVMATTNHADPITRLASAHAEWVAKGSNGPEPTLTTIGHFGTNAFSNGTSFTFTGMLAALPAVLFAYDSFLNVLSMSDKVKGGTEKLPKIVVVGIVAVIILYSLIALSAIFHGSGMVSGAPFGASPSAGYGIFDQIFSGKTAEAMGKFVIVFLMISTLGVINGISAGAVAVHEQAVLTNSIFGSKTLRNKFGDKKAVAIMIAAITVFWCAIEYVSVIVLKTDSFVDGISNFPTLFFFAIYATVITLYTLKRSKLDNKKINNILYKVFAWIAIIGIIIVVGYQFFYGFFINAILHPTETTHWGLYIGDNVDQKIAFPKAILGSTMTLAQASILLFSMLVVFIAFPILNKYLTKKFENNDVIVSTQQ